MVGLGSAFVLAILYWHLSFSRLGLEPILVPFFASLALAALVRGLNTGRWYAFLLAGVALGGSLYTYKAGYLVPLIALLFVAWAAVAERGFLRRYRLGLLLVAAAAVLVAAPIAIYFATHPANFWQRPASVALVSGEAPAQASWQALGQNLSPVLSMFFLEGDANPRSNLPGRPALDPFLASLFLVGLARSLVQFRRPARMLPLLWLGVMILPTLMSRDAPHFGRAIGATPALAVLCAVGGWSLWQGALRLPSRWASPWVRRALAVGLAAGLALSTVSTAQAYFRTWGGSASLFYAYDEGLVQVTDYMNARPPGEDVYLSPTPADHFTLQYLARRPFSSFDGRHGFVLPAPGHAATYIVLVQEDGATLANLRQVAPQGSLVWNLADVAGQPYAAAYHVPADGQDGHTLRELSLTPFGTTAGSTDAVLGGAVRLLGYSLDGDTVAPGEELRLALFWEVLEPLDQDYTAFTHLLGEYNPATGGPVWAGHDGQPDGGHYPTSTWQPGQIVIDVHSLQLPAETPRGLYPLEAGLYLLETLSRLPVTGSTGTPLPGDTVLLGTVEVRGASHEP